MDDVRAVMVAGRLRTRRTHGRLRRWADVPPVLGDVPRTHQILILYGSFPVRKWSPDFPWGLTPDQRAQFAAAVESDWGTGGDLEVRTRSADARASEWFATLGRMAASPRRSACAVEDEF